MELSDTVSRNQCQDTEKSTSDETPLLCDIFGGCGLYQILFTIWVAYMGIAFAFDCLNVTFLAPDIPFTCVVDERYDTDVAVDSDQCNFRAIINDSNAYAIRQPCTKWNYSTEFYAADATLTQQFNLVCGNEWLKSLANSIQQVGDLSASFFTSYFADKYGRRPVAIICVIPGAVAYTLFLFSPNIHVFIFAKFLSGLSGISVSYISFVILMEMIGAKHRGALGIISENLGWTFGYMALPGLFWLMRNAFHFQLFNAAFYAFVLLSYWVVPESARWLLLNNKKDEAFKVVKRIKFINERKPFDEDLVKKQIDLIENQLKTSITSETATQANVFHIFKGREMRKRSFIILFAWLTVGLVYFGISMNAAILGGDLYWNFFYLAVIEIPSIIISLFLDKYFGRRTLLLSSLMGTGLSYFITIAVPKQYTTAQIVMVVISKLFVASSFNFVYAFTSELYPTCLRGIGVLTASGSARIGSIVAPFAAQLTQTTNTSVTFGVFGVISIVSGALVWFLPETKNQPLPETLEDVNKSATGFHES